MEGKKFTEGWKKAVVLGLCIGGISAAASAGASYVANIVNKNIANDNANLLIKGLSSLKALKDSYQQAVSALGTGWQTVIGALHSGLHGLWQSAAIQLIFDGKVNWTAAIGCAFIAGAIGGARAGMNARKRNQEPDEIKREKDKKLVEKVLEDAEQGGTTDPKDEKNGPNEAVKGKSGCTAAVRNDETGNVEYGESKGKRVARRG
ncbi:hypothetical protein PRIPAC_74323, partial [Pristionchus pacificus]|uniref:Uncharacterized protein n=1 Tax=Pristionchus pacificus TaxID=54126 RepID=A0A2A6CGB1_PRIPA